MENIGLIGAGVMGFTVAGRILAAGHRLSVYDIAVAAAERVKEMGATLDESPTAVADGSDIVLLFLPGPKDVCDCLTAADGILAGGKPGTVVVDMGTTDPETSAQMAAAAAAKGVGYLDAPVLGRPVTVGQWTLPVGGKAADLDRCRPLLKLFAAHVFHVGPIGTGNKIKLLNQLMFGAINAMTAEMMAIAEKMGISPRVLYETITASQAGTVSNLFKELGGRIAREDYADPTFTVDLLVKDIRLAVQMAKANNAPPLLARTVELINEVSQTQGFGGKDTAIMWKSYRRFWETEGKP